MRPQPMSSRGWLPPRARQRTSAPGGELSAEDSSPGAGYSDGSYRFPGPAPGAPGPGAMTFPSRSRGRGTVQGPGLGGHRRASPPPLHSPPARRRPPQCPTAPAGPRPPPGAPVQPPSPRRGPSQAARGPLHSQPPGAAAAHPRCRHSRSLRGAGSGKPRGGVAQAQPRPGAGRGCGLRGRGSRLSLGRRDWPAACSRGGVCCGGRSSGAGQRGGVHRSPAISGAGSGCEDSGAGGRWVGDRVLGGQRALGDVGGLRASLRARRREGTRNGANRSVTYEEGSV